MRIVELDRTGFDDRLASSLEQLVRQIDLEFRVPLHDKVDIPSYCRKLLEKGTLVLLEDGGCIAGMVAGYTEDLSDAMAYISLVAVSREYRGRGYARSLVTRFLEICHRKGIGRVNFYTDGNEVQRRLYKSLGARQIHVQMEYRPDDLHLAIDVEEFFKGGMNR